MSKLKIEIDMEKAERAFHAQAKHLYDGMYDVLGELGTQIVDSGETGGDVEVSGQGVIGTWVIE